jgi:hypothetical protein
MVAVKFEQKIEMTSLKLHLAVITNTQLDNANYQTEISLSGVPLNAAEAPLLNLARP